MSVPSPRDSMRDAINRWEGLFQNDPADRGNYTPSGVLIGTMRGVTPAAYALWFKVDPETITATAMQHLVTDEVAASIAVKNYYESTHISMLPWHPVTANVLDFAWMSGPGTAIKALQRTCGTPADGAIGSQTVEAFTKFIDGPQVTNRLSSIINDVFANERIRFYDSISKPGMAGNKFRSGWLRRASWWLSSNHEHWDQWQEHVLQLDHAANTVPLSWWRTLLHVLGF